MRVHTHFSFLLAVSAFLAILPMGTLWRLVSMHLHASSNGFAQKVGGAMAFQY